MLEFDHGKGRRDGPCADGRTVLIVDDDASVRDMLSQLLDSVGFRCVEANTAEEATELVASLKPALGVLDIALPGASGAELAWRIKREKPDLPLIAVSGQLKSWDADDLADLGFARTFPKPFDPGAFLDACLELAGMPSTSASLHT